MAEQNDKESCNSCRFFSLGDRGMGLCHRYPNAINASSNGWCGEFSISSPAFQALVESIAEPSITVEIKKSRGRPKKS
jgi:hypothetical protein